MTEKPEEPAAVPPVPTSVSSENDIGQLERGGSDTDAPDQNESISEVFGRLYQDGRAYIQAERERQSLRIGIIGAGVRDAAIFTLVALMLIFAVLVALLIGLILALTPDLGPWAATGAVVSSAMIVAILLLLLAKARIGRMKKATTL